MAVKCVVIVGTEKALAGAPKAPRPAVVSAGDAASDRVVAFLKRTVAPEVAFQGSTLGQAVGWFHEESSRRGNPVSFLLAGDHAAKLAKAPVPTIKAKNIALCDALGLICESTGCRCEVRGGLAILSPDPEAAGK